MKLKYSIRVLTENELNLVRVIADHFSLGKLISIEISRAHLGGVQNLRAAAPLYHRCYSHEYTRIYSYMYSVH